MNKSIEIFQLIKHFRKIIVSQNLNNDSILNGNLGMVLYHTYYHLTFNNNLSKKLMLSSIESIIDRIDQSESTLTNYLYSNGLSGFGTIISNLSKQKLIYSDVNDLDIINDFVYRKSLEQIEQGNLEFLHGACGGLFFLSQNLHNQTVKQYADTLIEKIIDRCILKDYGIMIPSSNYFWNDKNSYNLSLSHGLCGFLLVLILFTNKGLSVNTALINFIDQCVKSIMKLIKFPKYDQNSYSFLPSFIPSNFNINDLNSIEQWPNSRLAWCYGDLGWVLLLYKFGKVTGNRHYLSMADKIGLFTTNLKTIEETSLTSAQFCHGFSGVSVFYRRLYDIRNLRVYRNQSNYWASKAIIELKKERDKPHIENYEVDITLLEGLIGSNLFLMSLYAKKRLDWTDYFLI